MQDKFKVFFANTELFTGLLLILVALVAFGLGRMSLGDQELSEERIEEQKPEAAVITATERTTSTYVGSVNSDKYHLPWCSGAQRINEENKIVFNSKKEAVAAGYVPAGNCKGI